MKLSARVTYGLRAALMLASHYGTGPVLGKDISKAESLPGPYLEQIMTALRRASIVEGTRGARGGYALTRAPGAITVTDLVVALDGPIRISECPDGVSCCGSPETCVLDELYTSVEMAVREVLDRQTLADLLERRRELSPEASSYDI